MDQQSSFRAAIGGRASFATETAALASLPVAPTPMMPSPFDALPAERLAGPPGSHPLAGVELRELVTAATDGLEGGIELDGPASVGEGISCRLRVRARTGIEARSAVLRLVGVRLAEQGREATPQPDPAAVAVTAAQAAAASAAASAAQAAAAAASAAAANAAAGAAAGTPASSSGAAAASAAAAAAAAAGAPSAAASASPSTGPSTAGQPAPVRWVEIHGTIIESLPFPEPALPATMAAGQMLELPFTIPAPRLGPPSAHAGVGAIAWAVEAHWEVAFGRDQRVAALVDVRQHPDLLRAGVLTLPSGAMNDAVTDGDATITLTPVPPTPAGSVLTVGVSWPDAPGGRSARVELTTDIGGATSLSVVASSVQADHEGLAQTSVSLPVPADAPPTLDTDGLKVGYRVRVIVDRKLRSDESRERAVVIS